jgi:hypothetical protein
MGMGIAFWDAMEVAGGMVIATFLFLIGMVIERAGTSRREKREFRKTCEQLGWPQ